MFKFISFAFNIIFRLFRMLEMNVRIYLIISLRNALKQAKIPEKSFHIIILSICFSFLTWAILEKKIGPTVAGTCSLASTKTTSKGEGSSPIKFTGTFIAGLYIILGIYTYFYIRKNAPKCAQAHAKRTKFLLYYTRYIVASSIVFGVVAVANILALVYDDSTVYFIYNINKRVFFANKPNINSLLETFK